MLDLQNRNFISVRYFDYQLNSEEPMEQTFFSCSNRFSGYGIHWWNPRDFRKFLACRMTILKASASFTFCSSVDIFGFSGLVSSSNTFVNSSQTSLKALCVSVGCLPHKVSILMYDLSTITVPKTFACSISSSRYLNTEYPMDETKHLFLPRAFS